MKKTLIVIALIAITAFGSFATNKFNMYSGTKSVSVNGKRFPLNTLVLYISPDSVRCQLTTYSSFGNSYDYSPVTPLDSIKHFYFDGMQLNNAKQIDSVYQLKFVQ